MKITKSLLRNIIKEEVKATVHEIFTQSERDALEAEAEKNMQRYDTAKASEDDHWTSSETFVHPDDRLPMDKYERYARDEWAKMMRRRSHGGKKPFPGDVRGGVGFKHGGRTYGGKY